MKKPVFIVRETFTHAEEPPRKAYVQEQLAQYLSRRREESA